jgi:flavin reductase (DIM6/NTAB) family NADH-FMN oxidoreductase RutF
LSAEQEEKMKVVKRPSTALYPVPVVLVSCGIEQPNIITLAWVGTVCSAPPMVGIAVRPNRHSHGLIKEVGQFVVNLPSADMLEAVDLCGTISGRDEDKYTLCGLTPAPASKVQVPLIAECPLHLECVVRETLSLGSHDLFIGEIVAVQDDERILGDRGQVDYNRANLLVYVHGTYHALGESLSTHGFSR